MQFMAYWGTKGNHMSKHTSRIARKRIASVNTGMKSIRNMLESFVEDNSEDCIALLNGIRPIEVMAYVLGRELTVEEGTAYLDSISNAPVHLRGLFAIGKAWQDCKQTARKYLQDKDARNELVYKFRSFVTNLESAKERIS